MLTPEQQRLTFIALAILLLTLPSTGFIFGSCLPRKIGFNIGCLLKNRFTFGVRWYVAQSIKRIIFAMRFLFAYATRCERCFLNSMFLRREKQSHKILFFGQKSVIKQLILFVQPGVAISIICPFGVQLRWDFPNSSVHFSS